MGLVRNTIMDEIKDKVYDIHAGGSTNLAAGMQYGAGPIPQSHAKLTATNTKTAS